MAITIVRHTGIMGMGGTIAIKINGKKVDKVKTEQQVEINIPNDHARLEVSQSSIRSNELEVNDGETIEITTPKWSGLILFLMIILPPLANFIPNFQYRTINVIIYVIVVMILLFSVKWYRIKKI
jgi:hypothetical protein